MLISISGEQFKNNKGNLKTAFMTWNLYLDFLNGRKIYTNYKVTFSDNYIKSFRNLIELLKKFDNISLGIDELPAYFDCYSGVSKNLGTWFLKTFTRQSRKRTVKMYYTGQNFEDSHKSVRTVTDKIYITKKLHPNLMECNDEFCFEEHYINVFEVKNNCELIYPFPKKIFDMFNSDEIIEFEELEMKNFKKGSSKQGCNPL